MQGAAVPPPRSHDVVPSRLRKALQRSRTHERVVTGDWNVTATPELSGMCGLS